MALVRKEESNNSKIGNIAAGQTHTILGQEAFFEGTLTFDKTVRIDGRFKGKIHTDDVLVIGESANVEATMEVGSIIVNGTVRGDIIAKRAVELHMPAHVYGNIETPSLVIQKGVVFEGTCRMENLDRKPNVLQLKSDENDD